MTVEHRKGPWFNDHGKILDQNGDMLAAVPWSIGDLQDHANARLIAAAPEMADRVEELDKVVHYMRTEIDRLKTIMDDEGLAY